MMWASPAEVCRWWLDEIHDAMIACGRPEAKARYVGAGVVPWDDCCGLLVVSPESVFRYKSFPDSANGVEDCVNGFIGLNLLVTLVRCAPTVSDQGIMPSPNTLDNSYSGLLEDAAVIWSRLSGHIPDDWERANLDQTFVGASGGCIAVETRLQIGLEQTRWVCCDS
jgi:hypothetical protein